MKKLVSSLSLLIFFSLNTALAQTQLVSHKGAWKNHVYPQNSLIGLKTAVDNGFKGIEFDIFRTKDNKFVLGHDNDITKVTTCTGKISDLNESDLKKCKVIKNTLLPITQILLKKVKKPQAITTLDEVVDLLFFDERLEFIWLDMKDQSEEVVPMLKALVLKLSDKKIFDKIVINNGSAELLARLKVEVPQFKYSLEGKWGSEPLTDYKKYIDGIGITHDYISLNVGIYLGHEPMYKILCRKKRFWKYLNAYLQETKMKSIPTIGWTVNRTNKIKKLREMDLEFLLTDRMNP